MAWGFTAEWLAERERKRKLQAMGSVSPVKAPTIHGNCELVTLEKRQQAREWNGQGAIPKTASGKPVSTLYPLIEQCRWAQIAEPTPEYKFHPHRKWRFDYAFPLAMLAVEIEGGLWANGRHSRGKGAIADLEKYSEAAILGWRLIYGTPQELESGVLLDRVVRGLTDA